MISAFARASQVFGEKKFSDIAENAAKFIQTNLYKKDEGILIRSYREGPANIEGFLPDYAFLIQGLLDLYEANGNISWLLWADQLQMKQVSVLSFILIVD